MALALLTLAALCAISIWQAVRLRRVNYHAHGLERRLIALEHDLRAVCAGASRVGDRLVDTEHRARSLARHQAEFESQLPQVARYRQAETLLKRGAQVEELVESCGLSRGEAELLNNLRRPQSAAH